MYIFHEFNENEDIRRRCNASTVLKQYTVNFTRINIGKVHNATNI